MVQIIICHHVLKNHSLARVCCGHIRQNACCTHQSRLLCLVKSKCHRSSCPRRSPRLNQPERRCPIQIYTDIPKPKTPVVTLPAILPYRRMNSIPRSNVLNHRLPQPQAYSSCFLSVLPYLGRASLRICSFAASSSLFLASSSRAARSLSSAVVWDAARGEEVSLM